MKLLQRHSLIFLVALCSCATAAPHGAARRPIELADMERLRPGQTTARELRSALGDPGQTIAMSATEETWVYSEPHGQSNWQRASFTLDKRSGTILASVLLLNDSDSLCQLDQAIHHFSTSRFDVKDEGWIHGREYSDNADYSDSVNGISMTVRKTRKTVSDISFWQPSDARAPIAAQKKSL